MPNTLNKGVTSFITQKRDKRSKILVIIAKAKPKMRPLSRCSGGSLLTKIAKKMILSIPSTISRALKVAKVIQASILNIHSNINFLENFKIF